MSLLKLPFLASGAMGVWFALTPPNPPPESKERQKRTGVERTFGVVVRVHAFVWKVSVLANIFMEAMSILSAYSGHGTIESLNWLHNHSPQHSSTLGPSFLLGWFATLTSGLLRLACYKALGRMFTFEITLRENHKLITRGPYTYVRHPSYTGIVLGVVGTLLMHFGPGSWFREVGWLQTTVGQSYAVSWVMMETYVLASIMMRVPMEDELLRRQFGQEWETWAAKVRYRVIPGIF
ncbi:hypothetical protein OF83DRAFT_1068801 [Amylostereum chailletii]|nr:hypothetical protein OF83DRAFT_1068801 [Amylostereum chailletii]